MLGLQLPRLTVCSPSTQTTSSIRDAWSDARPGCCGPTRLSSTPLLSGLAPSDVDEYDELESGILFFGNQIDAMALIRRSAWRQVGGYDPSMRSGWEDYDFWLRLLEAGFTGIQVPEILGRYRVHPHSMTNTVTGKSDALAKLRADLEAKYDWLALGRSAAPGPSISAPSASALHQNTEPDYAMVVPFRYFSQRDRSKETPIAAIVHIYYPEMAEELSSYLANLSSSACVDVSTNTDEKRSIIEDVFRRSHIENHEIRIVPNRGRDIAPKLITFADVYERHDYVRCLVYHDKRSLHIR